ncbi:hypothetical protein MMC25_001083 [Agyrium rufum]|nr:hypothetical protein [Agyrium rufum]
MRIYEKLRTINSSSRIASIVRASLRLKILDQANTYSVSLAELIDRCHFAYLKRLEVELRLIDIAFRSMSSRLLDVESPIRNDPIVASIDRVKQLCGTFPDTAGLFAPLYLELDLVVKNGQALLSIQGWASELASGLWHGFSKANPNYRVVCPYRHPYFESTFSDCPECGREVVYQPTKDADPVGAKPQLLGSNDFFAMINVKKRVTSLALSSGSTSTTKVTCSDKEEILMEEKNVIISEKEVEIWD